MVTYTDWISVAFDVAQSKGLESSFGDNAQVVATAADIWNDRKPELRNANKSTAKQIADEEIQVR